MARYKYQGDVNLEYGGYFYNASNWKAHGYADVVRIQPCSDAGAQDNVYWVDRLTVNAPRDLAELKQILTVVGATVNERGDIIDDYRPGEPVKRGCAEYVARVIDACIAYGRYDTDTSTAIQIGADDTSCPARERVVPDMILRGNTSLARYVRREYLRGAV